MTVYTYQFECTVLLRKILKLAKKQGAKSFFKEGFEFRDKYFICLEQENFEKIEENFEKIEGEDALVIESLDGGFWRIPLRKKGPKKGLKWWPSEDQIPNKEVVEILESLYAFLKA